MLHDFVLHRLLFLLLVCVAAFVLSVLLGETVKSQCSGYNVSECIIFIETASLVNDYIFTLTLAHSKMKCQVIFLIPSIACKFVMGHCILFGCNTVSYC